MANIKVSELNETTTFDDDDYTMIVQNNQSKKISKENMLDSVNSSITSNVTIINNTIASKSLVKLWENSSPTADFTSQNITLSSDNYDYLIIFWKTNKNSSQLDITITLKGYGAYINEASDYPIGGNSYKVASYIRDVNRISDTSYQIGTCYVRYGDSTARPTYDSNLIPIAIYGAKF